MTHSRVVLFTPNNARVVYTPDATLYVGLPNALVDPDLKAVAGVAPHFWKIVDGQVVPMSPDERVDREKHIADHGCINDHKAPSPEPLKLPADKPNPWLGVAFVAGILAASLLWRYLHG